MFGRRRTGKPLYRIHAFIYRCRWDGRYDRRCPIGGVVVEGDDEELALRAAWDVAETRYARRPGELLVVVPLRRGEDKRHAEMMQRDWQRAYLDFARLMTAGERTA